MDTIDPTPEAAYAAALEHNAAGGPRVVPDLGTDIRWRLVPDETRDVRWWEEAMRQVREAMRQSHEGQGRRQAGSRPPRGDLSYSRPATVSRDCGRDCPALGVTGQIGR
jgi:hypothetical protein